MKVLLVDNQEPFWRFVHSTLRKRPELEVAAVSDGFEASRLAEELHPDLVLLDIALPIQNGIDTAQIICNGAPETKIIFLSKETAVDIVQQVLNTGAAGYIIKAMVASDLLPAVEAVRQGKRFISAGLSGYHFA